MSETANPAEEELLERLRKADNPGVEAREILAEGQRRLDERFPEAPIRELVESRSDLVDQVLRAAWQLTGLEQQGGPALVAVGGYGRGELHPQSDVDLMILCGDTPDGETCSRIETLIALLWDTGLEIGHSVRTLDECEQLAARDITVATNIMEARTLAGETQLLDTLAERTGPERLWPPDQFYEAKRGEQVLRHSKHNDTEYNLEPDIKNAPGGLRDVQMVGWVAKRHFGVNRLGQLISHGFLTDNEYSILQKCQDFLWQIRWALHMVTGRNENRLLFDYQREVASLLGFRDSESNLGVEKFMKLFYRADLALSVLNEVLLQLFDEAILRSDEKQSIRPLNRRFQVHNDYLETTGEHTFMEHPSALLEMFVVLSENPELKGVRASTLRQAIEQRKLIDEDFRNDPANAELFMQLIRSPYSLFTQLRRMKRYGILGQYLPEFGRIIGMMQYDLFHIYTVDAHTLLVVKNMRRMRREETREQWPLACDVFYQLPRPELLYIAGLYHDIAKGRGGDHSQLGAEDAIAFCRRHGLSNWDTKLVAWLVRSHLIMSVTAQRKDISDPAVVHEFAREVGDLVHLDYLYVLTVADINATNPALWNSWRASLLRQLYSETKRALRRGLNNPVNKEDWIQETRAEALRLLERSTVSREQVEKLWSGIGDEYFLRENARDIAWHTEALLNRADPEEPLVLIRESATGPFQGGSQVFVYTPDVENLFAATVNALDQLNLTIMDARIITSADGFSLDTYTVLDEHGTPIGDDRSRIRAIETRLRKTLRNPENFRDVIRRRMPRRNKYFDVPTEVIISNDLANDRTVVDIKTLDRPGLLARIGRIFMEFRLLVQNARIDTLGEKAEDVFFVTDHRGEPISDPQLCRELQEHLRRELDQSEEETIG